MNSVVMAILCINLLFNVVMAFIGYTEVEPKLEPMSFVILFAINLVAFFTLGDLL